MKNCHGLTILYAICKNVSKNISIIYEVKQMLENNHLYMSHCSLILPYLSYACEILENTYKSQLHTLMRLQKKASYLDHIHPLFVQYKYLKYLDIVKLKTLITIYKAQNNIYVTHQSTIFFIITEEIHSYVTRSSK